MSDVLIPDGWTQVKLGDVCSIFSGFPFKSASWKTNGTPVIKITNVKRGQVSLDSCGHVSPDSYPTDHKFWIQSQDVLIALTGYVGELAFIGEQHTKCLINQRVGCLRSRGDHVTRFLFYLLSTSELQSNIVSLSTGSAQSNVSPRSIESISILLPPLHEQKAIAHILGALDDKIDQLRKTSSVLEDMASALFKSWFVDFDPVKAKQENRPTGLPPELDALFPDSFEDSSLGPIPTGWRVGSVGDVCDIHDSIRRPLSSKERTSMKGQYPYYGAASVLDHVNDYLFDGTYLLLGEDGSVVQKNGSPVLQYVWGKFWVSNHAHVLTGKGISTETLLTALRTVNVLPYVTGAVQPKISQGNLKRIPFILAPAGITSFIDIILVANFNKHKCNIHQIRTLTNLRDTLLPKLISGELRVPEAEQMVAELGL